MDYNIPTATQNSTLFHSIFSTSPSMGAVNTTQVPKDSSNNQSANPATSLSQNTFSTNSMFKNYTHDNPMPGSTHTPPPQQAVRSRPVMTRKSVLTRLGSKTIDQDASHSVSS
uniref:Uncharacterized protein n=1 Tax=Lygus hesperus TaxID=30085 RepID=A0A146KSM0_LYGHE